MDDAGAITIAANAVTLAKMAGLARGKLIYGDASGDPAALAAGANGKLLVADGNGDLTWTTVSGDATLSGAAFTIAAGAVEGSMLNTDVISAQTNMTGDVADTDELMISDAGTLKRVDFSVFRDAVFADVSGDAAVAAGGALTIAANAVEGSMLNDDVISGQTELAHADINDADELAISDGGTLKKVGIDSLMNHYFGLVSGDATIADGGALTIAATSIENSMLADNAVDSDEIEDNAVLTAHITDANVTHAKFQSIATMTVVGRTAGGAGVTSAVSILDQDNMSSDDATALATQQSIKAYVDNVASGLDVKDSVALATAAALPTCTYASGSSGVGATLTAAGNAVLTVDGVAVALSDRVLVKDQVATGNNGIYKCTTAGAVGAAFILTRATDCDTTTEYTGGAFTFVEKGSTNADAGFVCTSDGTLATLGTSDAEWAQFSGAGSITAGSGITKSGGTLSVTTAGVTNAMLADDAVGADELAADAVVNASIAAGAAIDMDKLDGSSLASALTDFAQDDLVVLADQSDSFNLKKITTSNFEDAIFGNVTGDATIAAGGALTIADDAVEQAMVADDAIGADQLAGSAVVTASIVDDNVTNAKLANMTEGTIKVGGGSDAPTDLDAKTSGQIIVGNGTGVASVAVSGDVTLASTGAFTIAANAVEGSMLNNNVISGQTELAHADIADADEFAISDGGTLKRVGVDSLRDHYFGVVSSDATIADGGALTIAANAVTLAKMAGIARGKIIVGDASGDPSALAAGAVGKLLVADANGDPTWTTVSGDATLSAGALTISAGAVEGSMLNTDVISAQTNMTGDVADTDELMISDAGTLKRVDFSVFRDAVFADVSGDATVAAGGALTIAATSIEQSMLADDAVGADELAADAVVNASIASNAAIDMDKLDGSSLASALTDFAQDDLVVLADQSDSFNLKKITTSNFEDAIFGNVGTDATIAAGGALTIANSAVTLAKMANLADMSVLGNASGGSAAPSAISILDEDNMATNSATALATQQSIKAYVDGVASGLDVKESVDLATAAALATCTYSNGSSGVGATLTGDATGVLTVDGVTVALNDRVLVQDQAAALQNGIYKCTTAGVGGGSAAAFVLTRATDCDSATEFTGGMFTFVEKGTANADSGFVCTTDGAITLGSTAAAFSQFSGAGSISAGAGLARSGTTLSLDIDTLGALSSVGNIHQTSDHFLISDGGTEKKITFSDLEDEIFGNISSGATIAAGGALTIAATSITNAMLADDAVNSDELADTAVLTAHITDLNVTTDKLAADAVTAAKLADDAVVTAAIVDANVTTAKLATDAVDGTKLADDAVDSEHYTDGSIDTDHVADLAITDGKLAGSISFAKLADSANIARLDQAETVAGIYTFSNATEASGSSRAASVGGALFTGGITTEKGIFVKGAANSTIATLGTPAEYGTSGEHKTAGGFIDYRQVVKLGGSLQMARLNGEVGTDQSVLCDLSDATKLAAGHFDGSMIYVTTRMNQTTSSAGALGNQALNKAAAMNNFDVGNKFYFCEEGVWHCSAFATAAEE
jgi:hypothetical protein